MGSHTSHQPYFMTQVIYIEYINENELLGYLSYQKNILTHNVYIK